MQSPLLINHKDTNVPTGLRDLEVHRLDHIALRVAEQQKIHIFLSLQRRIGRYRVWRQPDHRHICDLVVELTVVVVIGIVVRLSLS